MRKEQTMGEGTCFKCGGATGFPEDVSPSLWCSCPVVEWPKYYSDNLEPEEHDRDIDDSS
jgi:hypothetical protein